MSVASVVPTAIDKLVSILSAVSGFTTFDGAGITDDAIDAALFIGWSDPDETGFDESAGLDQSWPWLGHTQRDETAQIHCVAMAWNGDADMQAVRNSVFATLAAVGTTMQADPSLGTLASPVSGVNQMWVAGIRAGSFTQNQASDGAFARLRFDIEVRGRVS